MVRLHRFLIFFVGSAVAFAIAAAGAEIPVGGQVVGADGKGLAGVRVGLEPIPPDFERVDTRLGGKVGPGLEVEGATDAHGFFELAAPRFGAWKVVVAWEGDGELAEGAPAYVAEEYVLRPLADPTELPPVTLQPASAVEIEVVDADGKPADARVGLSDRRRGRDGWHSRLRLGRTGKDGVVRLPLGAEEEPQLAVLGPSHPIASLSGDELRIKGGKAGLRLARGVAGTAVVTDRRGRAVAGAVAYQGSGTVPLGHTDEEGRLRLVVAPPDGEPLGVSFVTPDGQLAHFEPRFSPGQENVAEVVVEPLPRIHGKVVDLESRDPLPGALVWVAGGPVALTDPHGRYELRLFPRRWVNVQAVATGYAMAVEGKELTRADSEQGPTMALEPAASVSGSVVDSEGNPLAGVEVSVKSDNLEFRRSPVFRRGGPSTFSTRRGRFHLSGLPLSAGLELRFLKSGFAPSSYEIDGLEAFEERSGVEVVLGSGKSGVGWVVDVDDAPVSGAAVRLVPVQSGDPMRAVYRMPQDEQDEVSSQTDAEGRFRLTHLAAGRYNLEVAAPGFAPFTVPGLAVSPGPGEKDFGTVVLEPGVRLEGVVVDPRGSPIAGAEVYAGRQERRFFARRSEPVATSDGSGRFVVADLQAGKQYQVTVSKSGFSSDTSNVVAKEGEKLEMVLRPAGAISGRVVNEDGDPVEEAAVFVEVPPMTRFVGRNPMRPAQTDDQGAFRLEGVDPGTVQVSVQAQGYQKYQVRDLEVPSSGELSGLEIVLARGATIVGAVTRSDGTPVVDAMVTYAAARENTMMYGGFQANSETDGEGRYRFDGVAPGPAVVQAQQGAHSRVSKSVEVGSGTHTVDLVFEDGFEVSGRVSDTTGAPVAGAALTLTVADVNRIQYFSMGSRSPVVSGGDGTFTVKDVAAGRYLLSATKDGYAQAATPEPFEVSNGPVTGIELELGRGATLRGRILGLAPDDLAAVVVHAFGGAGGAGGSRVGIVDYEGRYSVPNLGSGAWHVMARLEASGRQAAGQVTVEEGQAEAALDLEFKTGFTLEGVVRSGGRPQPGIHVSVVGLELGLGHAQAASDSDGRFLIADLPAGKYRLAAVSVAAQRVQEVEVPADGEVVIELGVQRISGHVLDETGERPLAGAGVRIESLGEETPDLLFTGSGRTMTETDSRGFFSLNANEGVYRLIATKAGYGPSETTVEVAAGLGHEGVELRLYPTEGISFDLLPDSGAMPAQVSTAVFDPSGQVLTQGFVPVGEGGTVRLSTVPAGTWELAVQAGDSAVVRAQVTAPGHVGQIRLPLGGVLHLKVAALAGQSPTLSRTQLAKVQLVGPDGRPHYMLENLVGGARQWPLWNGEATIPRLSPGLWKFTVSHPDGRSWTGEAMVAAGETSEVAVP